MTVKEKLSMFFNRLLDEVDEISNQDIREKALLSLLQQVEMQLTELHRMLIKQEEIIDGTSKQD